MTLTHSQKKWLAQNWKAFVFLSFLVLVVYLNSLGNGLVADDLSSLGNNPKINDFSFFILPYFPFFSLFNLFQFISHLLVGPIPAIYRLVNILFHLGSTLIVYVLGSLFFVSPINLFMAGIFAIHPLQSEAITWISGGPYSQYGFFLLLSFLTYFLSLYPLSLLSFALALFTSEKAIVFPLILFLFALSFQKIAKTWKSLIPFFILSGFWVLIYIGRIGSRLSTLETNFYAKPVMNNPLLQIPIAITSYLELIFWPKNLTLYHSEMSFSQGNYILRLGAFILFLATIVFFFKKDRRVFFWLSFFLISLLPTLTPLGISWIVAERYVYLGTLGIIVVAALAIQKIGEISKNKKVSYVIFGIIILVLSIRTIIRNTDWKNQDTLWLATAKTSPSSPQNHNNLGDYYARHGDLEKAIKEFQRAITLNPNYGDAYHNLANTYQQMKKYDLAIENYQKALSFNPNLWQSHLNLGIIYFEMGQKQKAESELQKVLQVDPQNQIAKQLLLSLPF